MIENVETKNVVLVVDDSPETLSMLNDTLETAGMTALVALDGYQGLSIAKMMAPDIILLDAIMPNMDGFTTCEQLKGDADLKNIPVIFMTGLSDTESVVKGFALGSVDYVTKPINPSELIARIKVHLANARVAISTKTALDCAGQNICAVNVRGELLWATPEVQKLLEKTNTPDWPQELFATPIERWLQHSPPKGAHLKIATKTPLIKLIFVDTSGDNEYLLRIVNEQKRDETEVLKQVFSITTREAEVLMWVAKGKTNREIALILNLSPRTINKHLEQLFKKVDVDNRTNAATIANSALQNQRGY